MAIGRASTLKPYKCSNDKFLTNLYLEIEGKKHK